MTRFATAQSTQPSDLAGPDDPLARRLWAVPGLVVFAAGVIYNHCYWGPLYCEKADTLPWGFTMFHWAIDLVLLLGGALLVAVGGRLGPIRRWARTAAAGPLARRLATYCWVVPPMDRTVALLIVPVLAVNLLYLGIVESKEGFLLDTLLPWVKMGSTVVFETGLFVSGVLLLAVVCRCRPLAIAFAFFYLATRVLDVALYNFGHTVFERQYLVLSADYAIEGWMGLEVLGNVALLIGMTAMTALALYLGSRRPKTSTVTRWACFTLAFALVAPARLFFTVEHTYTAAWMDRDLHNMQWARLSYATQNSAGNMIRELLAPSEPTAQTVPTAEAFAETIAAYRLPLGPRNYPALGLKPFRRVVFVGLESLSMNLISTHNPHLTQDNSWRFFGAPDVLPATFVNYRTTALPTQRGLTATLTSHPNIAVAHATQYRGSVVHQLREAGFRSILIRPDSRFYSQEHIHWTDAGYERIISREDFERRDDTRALVAGWGVCDRAVYDEIIRQLKAHRDEKIFIHSMHTDTHLPVGRRDYCGLDYPDDYPGEPGIPPGPHMLRATHRADFDLRRFLNRLKEEGLWDESTLVFVSADHCSQLSPGWQDTPGYPTDPLHNIPLIVLTPQRLPLPKRMDLPACQLDFAPTLLHLLGLPIPEGYWGTSLLAPAGARTYVGWFRKTIRIETGPTRHRIHLPNPKNDRESRFIELYQTLILTGLPDRSESAP